MGGEGAKRRAVMEQNQRFLFRGAVKTFVSACPDNSPAIDKDMTGVFACARLPRRCQVCLCPCLCGRGNNTGASFFFFPSSSSSFPSGWGSVKIKADFYSPSGQSLPGVN